MKAQFPLDMKTYADSLNRVINTTKNDSVKAQAYLNLMAYWANEDTAKAKQILQQARTLGARYPYIIATSYASEGFLFFNIDEVRSEVAYLKADSLLSKFATPVAYRTRSKIWNNIAVIRQLNDRDRDHIDIILNKAVPLARLANDSNMIATEITALAVTFMNLEQYDKAEIYLNEAIKILERLPDQFNRLAAAYNRAGENFLLLKKYPQAKAVLNRLENILAPYPESEQYSIYCLIKGMYEHYLGKYGDAINSLDKGIARASGTNKQRTILELKFQKTRTLLAFKKYTAAKKILTELLNDKEAIEQASNRVEMYKELATANAGLGNMPEAYQWQKMYTQLSDSLTEVKLTKDINELEIKYHSAENEKKIIRLESEKKQAVLAGKNSRLTSWLLAVGCFLFISIAGYSIILYRKNKKISDQQLKDIQQQQEIKLAQAMLQSQEEERNRVARDLHDGIGSMLAAVKINLSAITSDIGEQYGQQIKDAMHQLDNSASELRHIAHNMMPDLLLRYGLEAALKELAESFISKHTSVDLQCLNISQGIPLSEQLSIYRIVQELLTNAVKHAGAGNILLQCSQNEKIFLITVEDNGKGFDIEDGSMHHGMGIANIKNRIAYLNGTIEYFRKKSPSGTIVNIELYVTI
ncbi:tetratricopeptide repeat-containing sensor histidine kinase [Niabella beijingensis]|uniref:tetratricopeptide repeat-containing sensor histidine kinase n=1 Tax=Niabella beijingensis TaxID=2872700 RepID=UPI001CC0F0B8|nr:tetratricopeptide repeat-containing sensor histidine kinase [Niabella beijingensis]MBZ4187509.1 tetratricopeptide repeat protein [Niabella beijingensis]